MKKDWKLGLIGHPLGHSWSPEIHGFLIGADYQKIDLLPEDLEAYLSRKDFDGLNVTIPYKQAVIPYLDEIDPTARAIGAVNCIVNQKGKLKGYNTDCLGFKEMLEANNFNFKGKKTAVLGTGGASKAVSAALEQEGADILHVSRRAKEDAVDYGTLYEMADSIEAIVNTTPVGMFPRTEETPVDLRKFTHLKAVVDIIANPLRTSLCFEAKMLGIPYLGGFEMLVRQAYEADRIFTGQAPDPDLVQACMNMLYAKKRNIVLIGMPTSGKTTLASLLGKETGREVIEMDEVITKKLGTSIETCFETKGEAYFRKIETETAEELRTSTCKVISCGGGIIKNQANLRALSENGIIVWIQRDLSHLYATKDRPLTGDESYMKKLYEERKPLYEKYSDIRIDNNGTLAEALQEIMEKTGVKRK